MHPFEEKIAATIGQHGLLRKEAPVLVALSGGADSVALLAVLCRLGYECIAAHCNFQLRGDESLRDMRHAESVCRLLGVNIYIREFDVGRRTGITGESIEMACRALRYEWFNELLDRDYSQAVAVGHHSEDNVETFFINLLRSTGIAGLTGMDYRRGHVVRPLLDATRREIEDYLADTGLQYVTDSSNLQNDFLRNRLRNVVLPAFEAQFPGATASFLAVMKHLRHTRLVVSQYVDTLSDRFGTDTGAVDIKAVVDTFNPELADAVIYEMLKPLGLNGSQIDDIAEAARSGRSGLKFVINGDRIAELDRGILSTTAASELKASNAAFSVSLGHDIVEPVKIEISRHNVVGFSPERNPDVIYLDEKAVTPNAVFEIRRPVAGDRMRPFGMKGEKLVSDILKDAKFSAAMKRHTWLLTRNGVVIWILGLRASSHYNVTPRTRHYLRLRYMPQPTHR